MSNNILKKNGEFFCNVAAYSHFLTPGFTLSDINYCVMNENETVIVFLFVKNT